MTEVTAYTLFCEKYPLSILKAYHVTLVTQTRYLAVHVIQHLNK